VVRGAWQWCVPRSATAEFDVVLVGSWVILRRVASATRNFARATASLMRPFHQCGADFSCETFDIVHQNTVR
jgi:hypothetical protein